MAAYNSFAILRPIWEAALGEELLRVDSTGRVMFYQAGPWEQRLMTLIEET